MDKIRNSGNQLYQKRSNIPTSTSTKVRRVRHMNKILVFLSIIFISGFAERGNEILSYGIVENQITKTEPNSELLSGVVHIIESWNLVKTTDKIPKELGAFLLIFGVNKYGPIPREGEYLRK